MNEGITTFEKRKLHLAFWLRLSLCVCLFGCLLFKMPATSDAFIMPVVV